MWFDKSDFSVRVEGLEEKTGCIQLEVKYTGRPEWLQCGDCIDEDRLVPLSDWCSQSSSTRKRRNTQEIHEVRARRCHGDICSEPLDVTQGTFFILHVKGKVLNARCCNPSQKVRERVLTDQNALYSFRDLCHMSK